MQRIEFGADGIRGQADEWPFIKPVAYLMGQALGQYALRIAEQPTVVIGRDTRPSGANLSTSICAGLMSQGVHVTDLGVITTPGVAYITRIWKYDLGIIVSASHSPCEMNGIKVVKQNGLRLQREEEIEIEFLINGIVTNSTTTPLKNAGVLGQETDGSNLVNMYIENHIKRCPVKSLENFRIVLDCANGATSEIAPQVFNRLGATVTTVNSDVNNGRNINHLSGSEYVRVNPADLLSKIVEDGADYGFAFDGDGDRLVIVDKHKNIFDGHDFLFVLARHFKGQSLLKKNRVATIYQANRGLELALSSNNIYTSYTKNGDKNLEAALWGKGFLLGGEPGGNIIINDGFHTAADAIYTAILIAGLLLEHPDQSLIMMVDDLRQHMGSHPHKMISVKTVNKLKPEQFSFIVRKIHNYQQNLENSVRIMFWASQTEPKTYRILVEGQSLMLAETVERVVHEIEHLIYSAIQ